MDVEDLAGLDLLRPEGDAPQYWRDAQLPRVTPAGRPVRSGTGISTVQEGLALVGSGEHAMLVCRPLADQAVRGDVRYLPVDGLADVPGFLLASQLALVWRRDRPAGQLAALAELLA